MKKASKALLALLLMAVMLCLSGCAATSNEVNFFEDGSVAVITSQYISQAYMDLLDQTPEEYFASKIAEGEKIHSIEIDGNTYWYLDSDIIPQAYNSVDDMMAAMNDTATLNGAWEVTKKEEMANQYQIIFKKTMTSRADVSEENGQPADNTLVDVAIDEITISDPDGIAYVKGLEEGDYTREGDTIHAILRHKDTEYTAEIAVWMPTPLTGTIINDLDVTVEGLKTGNTPADVKVTVKTTPEGGVDPDAVKVWWDESEVGDPEDLSVWTELKDDDKFDLSKYYNLHLEADLAAGYDLSVKCTAFVNGEQVEAGGYWNPETAGFNYLFEPTETAVALTPVKSVAVTLDVPEVGKTVDEMTCKVVTDPAGAFGEPQLVWSRTTKEDAGAEDWEDVFFEEKFESGYYYACDIIMEINNTCEAFDDTPVTINGEKFEPPFGIQVFYDETYAEEGEPHYFIVNKHFDLTEKKPEAPKELTTPFVDVPKDAYYYDATVWAFNAEPQITDGNGKDKFMPEQICTRGQVVTFLWRSAGQPAPAKTVNPFEDVKEADYFYQPVLWAFYNDTQITDGTDPTHFSPNNPCKNSHILTFIYRAMGEPGKTGEGTWYTDAYNWANYKGLLKGTYEGTYDINAQCPRKNVVQYLYQYYVMSSK